MHLNPVKDRQVVEVCFGLKEAVSGQRVSGFDLHFAQDRRLPCMEEPGDDHILDKRTRSFLDDVMDSYLVGFWVGDIVAQCSVPVAEVLVGGNEVCPILCNLVGGEGFALARLNLAPKDVGRHLLVARDFDALNGVAGTLVDLKQDRQLAPLREVRTGFSIDLRLHEPALLVEGTNSLPVLCEHFIRETAPAENACFPDGEDLDQPLGGYGCISLELNRFELPFAAFLDAQSDHSLVRGPRELVRGFCQEVTVRLVALLENLGAVLQERFSGAWFREERKTASLLAARIQALEDQAGFGAGERFSEWR